MIRKGIVIDTQKNEVIYHCTYEIERVDGMYNKVFQPGKTKPELIPAAYVFPSESELAVKALLTELRQAKKVYDDTVARIYYKEFPQWR